MAGTPATTRAAPCALRALEGGRKQVTVLFCDFANSTWLAGIESPEQLTAPVAGPGWRAHHDDVVPRPCSVLALSLLLLLASCLWPPAMHADSKCIVLEDFAKAPLNSFPPAWKAREEEGKVVYSVQTEDGIRFLRARAKGVGIQGAKPRQWNLIEYPVLVWKWRPRVFPEGANERSGKNDSALAVYAVFPYTRLGVKLVKSVKYIWSERVRSGTHLESSGGRTQVRVLRTGLPADRNAWMEERANVVEDYKRFFKEDVRKPGGIAVLTDADDTNSYAEGDYADFRACRR